MLYTYPEIAFDHARRAGIDYEITCYISSPVILQINIRFDQSKFLESVKNKKTVLFKIYLLSHPNRYLDSRLTTLAGDLPDFIILSKNHNLVYLLLDMPPPCHSI
jgi:hypothetical protein